MAYRIEKQLDRAAMEALAEILLPLQNLAPDDFELLWKNVMATAPESPLAGVLFSLSRRSVSWVAIIDDYRRSGVLTYVECFRKFVAYFIVVCNS